MAGFNRETLKVLADVAFLVGTSASMYYLLKMLFESGDATRSLSKDQKKRAISTASRLDPETARDLSEYEARLLANVVHPEEIATGFEDIGGLEFIVEELRESVLFPLTHMNELQSTPLLHSPKGVLLYGPPGCGKTMLAKALAKESGANFINIQMSTLMDKWYGESNKIVAGLFSLANKLKPCIIFIDEIDSFLRERASSDHEASALMKAEFMTWWDGLSTAHDGGVMILGATNRPFDIDEAILRRMPKRFEVQKPSAEQRLKILQVLLKSTPIESDLDWTALVGATANKSGSDLEEFCRDAAMKAMRELYRTHYKQGASPTLEKPTMRPLRTADFVTTLSMD